MDISVLGVDLGKNVCSVVGMDASGAVVMRRKVRRETLNALAEKILRALSGWRPAAGRPSSGLPCSLLTATTSGRCRPNMSGPTSRRRRTTTPRRRGDRGGGDPADDALCRTGRARTNLDMQTLHRSRDRLVGERTVSINLLRGILLERGMHRAEGQAGSLEQLLAVLMDERGGAGLSSRMIVLGRRRLAAQWAELDRRIFCVRRRVRLAG